MIFKNHLNKIIVVGVLCMAFLTQPAQAYAFWRGGWGWGWHYPLWGAVGFGLGAAAVALTVAGQQYYYENGVYYTNTPQGYIVVSPPAGSVISGLPAGYSPIIVNGATYYTRDGIYYQYTNQGYMVVTQPAVTVVPPVVSTTADQPVISTTIMAGQSQEGDDVFTINIPNDKGGYTSVILKRYGNGFVGPQGENYSEFPKISQLKSRYGK